MFFEDNPATVVAPAREAAEPHAGVALLLLQFLMPLLLLRQLIGVWIVILLLSVTHWLRQLLLLLLLLFHL
jgi:hypothetical protein